MITVISLLKQLSETRVNLGLLRQCPEAAVVFNAAPFTNPQKDDAVDDALDGEIDFTLGELPITECEVFRQFLAPRFNGEKTFVINLSGAALAFVRFCILVERAFENCAPREDAGDFMPAVSVFGVGNVEDAGNGSFVFLVGLDAAIVNDEFIKDYRLKAGRILWRLKVAVTAEAV